VTSIILPQPALHIGGRKIVAGVGGEYRHVNPTTGAPQASVPLAGPQDVDSAVQAAVDAFSVWSAMPPSDRRDILISIGTAIADHAEELSMLMALETGLPVSYGAPVTRRVREWALYYAGWADKLEGSVHNTLRDAPDFSYSVYEPYGVIGIIFPWNNPTYSVGMKLFAALAAGNTVVMKPAELNPFSMLRVVEIAQDAGLPDGVLNLILGRADVGQRLVAHPLVDKISFTGGPETGRKILATCAENLKPSVMELGGKSPTLVFDDANVDQAVAHVARGLVAVTGQTCIMGSRVVVQDDIYEMFLARLSERVGGIVAGDPGDPETVFGPVATEDACERILGMVHKAVDSGEGRLVAGGGRLGGKFANGFFVEPTIIADVEPSAAIAQEEVFGPVVTLHRFRTDGDAVSIANATPFGLGAYMFSRSVTRVHRVASQIKSGGVYVNGGGFAQPNTPFGGIGSSGFGREGGRAGIEEFVRHKTVSIGGGS